MWRGQCDRGDPVTHSLEDMDLVPRAVCRCGERATVVPLVEFRRGCRLVRERPSRGVIRRRCCACMLTLRLRDSVCLRRGFVISLLRFGVHTHGDGWKRGCARLEWSVRLCRQVTCVSCRFVERAKDSLAHATTELREARAPIVAAHWAVGS